MFIISQYLLHKSKLCSSDNISTYSIAVGLIIYSSIYLYLLYYNNDFLFIFNKFIIFIIGIDLLLSTFYHFNNENIQKLNNMNFEESFLIENNNKIQEHLSISDDELTEDFDEDFDEEVVQDNESEDFDEEVVQDNESENLEEPIQDVPSEYLPTENIQDVPSEYLPTENIQDVPSDSEIKKLLQSIPIDNNVSNNEIVVEQPKPKAKRQPRKKINKVIIDDL
jgi:hypothetical protein